MKRSVVDRTGVTGTFDFDLNFAADNPSVNAAIGITPINPKTGSPLRYVTDPSLFRALREQAGLKSDAGNAPVEILDIERVEKPLEN